MVINIKESVNRLIYEHDEHMRLAYSHFMAGEDATAMWAYAAGLLHAIRTLEDVLDLA